MKQLKKEEVARLVDISAVRSDSSWRDVNLIIESAKVHNFICVFPMPGFIPQTKQSLKDFEHIHIGGVVGFPSGGETTSCKIFQAQELKTSGCHEIDMVMNIGKLKSGMYEDVQQEICQIKEAVTPLPLKVIIEVSLLTDDEIIKSAQLAMAGGADFVKTGTGWFGPTSMHHVNLIKSVIGDKVKLKVAGGVRSLAMLEEMYHAGVNRFGIGYKSALEIMEECVNRDSV